MLLGQILLRLVFLPLTALGLSGCGKTGPLYLPQPASSAAAKQSSSSVAEPVAPAGKTDQAP